MLRWLLPMIAAIALVGSSVTSWAAAGIVGDTECCCPVKAKCKCHDHDGKDQPPTLKRCGGQAQLVAPIVVAAIAASPPVLVIQQQVSLVSIPSHEVTPDDRTLEPETPPF